MKDFQSQATWACNTTFQGYRLEFHILFQSQSIFSLKAQKSVQNDSWKLYWIGLGSSFESFKMTSYQIYEAISATFLTPLLIFIMVTYEMTENF